MTVDAGSGDSTDAPYQFPSYEITEFSPKRTKYCVIIPTMNEGERVMTQLGRMKPFADAADIVISDKRSTDGSMEPEFLQSKGVRTLLTQTGPGRLGAGMRMALDYALRQGYEGFIFIDGNNKDDPAAIPGFVKELEKDFDHIQGSRFIEGGKAPNTPFIRTLTIRCIHAPMISLASRRWQTDTTNGFRAYSKRLITDPRVNPFRDVFSNYNLLFYLAIRAARLKYKMTEIPVTRAYPSEGEIPTKISLTRGYPQVLITLIKACLHRFDP